MKIDMIDLKDFFNDKYRNLNNNLGIGATGIITESQMVTRFKESLENKDKKIVFSHFEVEGNILHDIFGFDKELFLGFGYNPTLYKQLDNDHKNVLSEMARVKYINDHTGNHILIFLPSKQKTLTQNQFDAIEYIGKCVHDVAYKISKPIQILATDRVKSAKELNSLQYTIIPFLKNHIDDTYKQSIPDCNIIAKDDLKVKVLK